jgi:UDP-N-acetylmuramoyl-tripeptide--D-alanyl-D-alanine ligase
MPRFDPLELARWCGGAWVPRPPEQISGIVHDTRNVGPGSLFVALRGARFDGHDFVAQAVGSGACGAVVSRAAVPAMPPDVPLLVVADPARALLDLAAGYRRRAGLKIVGVTGSAGKTTVKDLIAALVETTHPTARTRGNWNNEIGLPLSLLAMPETTRVGVVELGISHPGEMEPLCRVARPDWGVITTVGPVHLEFFGTVEAIAREKGQLFRGLPEDGTAVLSRDEPYADLLMHLAPCRAITTSLRGDADYTLVRDDRAAGECDVREQRSGETFSFRMPLAGAHNRHNVLLAIAVARGLGVSWADLRGALERFVPPPMRWECRDYRGVTVINDAYNANPLGMRAAVQTFKEQAVVGGKWLVLGDMLELGRVAEEEHLQLGRFLGGEPWAGLIVVGTLGAHIARGAAERGLPDDRIVRCQTTEAAADVLLKHLRPGDGVLVKASRGKHLEDVVNRLAQGLGS